MIRRLEIGSNSEEKGDPFSFYDGCTRRASRGTLEKRPCRVSLEKRVRKYLPLSTLGPIDDPATPRVYFTADCLRLCDVHLRSLGWPLSRGFWLTRSRDKNRESDGSERLLSPDNGESPFFPILQVNLGSELLGWLIMVNSLHSFSRLRIYKYKLQDIFNILITID